jgi:hypothetical protein
MFTPIAKEGLIKSPRWKRTWRLLILARAELTVGNIVVDRV